MCSSYRLAKIPMLFVCFFLSFQKQVENNELIRLDDDKIKLGDEEAERGRRLTYDHGQAFGGDSSPYRAENYEALVDYLTDIGQLWLSLAYYCNSERVG